MFNDFPQSDDVEVYETVSGGGYSYVHLSESCKSNIIIQSNWYSYVSLPSISYIGKTINITVLTAINGTGKVTTTTPVVAIQHSNTTIFTLKQGTVSFMYVGQQLNGLTATDKAKSGWIILGGVQGDTAITGYAGSVAIGSGAYCVGANAISLGSGANSGSGVALGQNASINSGGLALGSNSSATGSSTYAIGNNAEALATYSLSIGHAAKSATARIALKSNSNFSLNGDSQAGKFILMRQTADATPTVMTATNSATSTTNILILPNNGTYAFKGTVVAKDATTLDSVMWEVTALMKRGANASTTALVGTPTVTKVFNDAGAAAWTITLTADTTNGGGAITVTGEAGKTIRWVSNIDSCEVI